MDATTRTFVTRHLADPRSSWSVGVRGAIAEYLHTDGGVPHTAAPACMEVASEGGAIRIEDTEEPWQTRGCRVVYFSLPRHRAAFGVRNRLVTEVGPDTGSVFRTRAGDTLFDLGLDIAHVQVCVRTGEPGLLEQLRRHCGKPLLAPDGDLVRILASTSPHRVFVSRLARIEIYAPIPTDRTPRGPHTHLLPELLGTAETDHERVPADHEVCLSLYLPY